MVAINILNSTEMIQTGFNQWYNGEVQYRRSFINDMYVVASNFLNDYSSLGVNLQSVENIFKDHILIFDLRPV